MKPLRIQITNFGAIPAADIDLTGITVAAIAGPNGAGKSTAFTIAPMFALFGTTKTGTSADDMVRTGTTEAAVTFDFEHHGDVWRVIRTRSTKGKGKSTLELQRRAGELWAAESGATIAETQKKIIDLINLDEDTFLASSMIMQGKANEFTSRPAGQRKAILAQILQLDQYDTLQERARAKVTAVNMDLAGIRGKVADIDARLGDRPRVEEEKFAAEIQLAEHAGAITTGETALQAAQTEQATVTANVLQSDKLREQATAAANEAIEKGFERGKQAARLEKANELLTKEATVVTKAGEYEATRDRITALKAQQEQQRTLAAEGTRLNNEQIEVTNTLAQVEKDIAHLRANEADRPRLEKAKADYQMTCTHLADYENMKIDDVRLRGEIERVQHDIRTAEKSSQVMVDAMSHSIGIMEGKAAMLADAQCVDVTKASCRFLADAKKAEAELPDMREQRDSYQRSAAEKVKGMQTQLVDLEQQLKTVGFDPAEYARLQEQMADLKPLAELYDQLDKVKPFLDNLQAQRADLAKRQSAIADRLDEARRQYRELAEKLADLPALEANLAILEPWYKAKEQLPAARQAAETAQEAIVRLDGEIAAATSRAEELQKELETVGDTAAALAEADGKVAAVRRDLAIHRQAHTELTAKLGGLQARLDAMDRDEAQRRILAAEMEPLAKQLTRWQTLVKAFGRDGIPALIIENAVPELERIANDILGQMSGGRNFLRFDTQKELKSRDGMAETLEIIVGDWAGERKYETFSGGEQLRIDFAIRFALAELLTRRAGNKIDWLVIDEGFGSQSEEYLPLVIDAVKEVTNRFGMVIVISHVRAVQEAFEQKIMFRPVDGAVEVAAA